MYAILIGNMAIDVREALNALKLSTEDIDKVVQHAGLARNSSSRRAAS